MYEPPVVLARGDGVGGEVVLRRRTHPRGAVDELIVNGTFLMDTAETSTERLLADAFVRAHPAPERVLVGGLGLGFTVRALLDDPRVRQVDVVELEPLLVQWARAGIVASLADVVADPRVQVSVADVRATLAAARPRHYDGVLLDVDNGPDFLVHAANAELYGPRMLGTAASALRDDGLLGVWSAAPSVALVDALDQVVGPVTESVRAVDREGRQVEYHVYLARRRPGDRPRDALGESARP